MPDMLMYPHIDPVAVQIGPLAVHWYGITYLVAFGLFLFLGTRRLHHPPFKYMTGERAWARKDVEDILFLGVLGVVVGGRIGYCLFYKPGYYLSHPLEILAVWQGGMSFHGGLLGVSAAIDQAGCPVGEQPQRLEEPAHGARRARGCAGRQRAPGAARAR
jgi:phosphatidylglycerol:prolipoprotein diacylglycerol transferase